MTTRPRRRSVADMKIIVGIDAREQQADALALGADLARIAGGRLLVTYVYPWSRAATRLGAPYALTVQEDAEELLKQATAGLEGVEFERRAVAEPSAARGLHGLAEEEQADLIVIGSPHRGPVGRTLVGGNGERIMHGSRVPVAVAPRGYAQGGVPKRIGVGYDGSDEAKHALSWAARLAQTVGGTVKILEVYVPVPVMGGYPGVATYPYDELDRTMREECQAELVQAIAALPDDVRPSGEMLHVPVADSLAAAAKDLDLLVIGSRGYGPHRAVLLGGVAHSLSHTSPCPLIVLPRSVGGPESEPTEPASAAARS